MQSISIQKVNIAVDRVATESVYKQIESGSPERCGCADCRNFAMQRAKIHPPEALHLFEALGIDFSKESEIYNADHFYGGWFHFIGKIVSGEETIVQITPTYKLEFSARRALLPKQFGNDVVCQVEFYVENVPRITMSEPGLTED